MKILFLFAALTIAFASSVLAQIQGPPPPANDYFPEQWQTYEFKDDKCKIRLPGKPKESPTGPSSDSTVRTNNIEYKGVVRYVLTNTEFTMDAEKIAADILIESSKRGLVDGMKKLEPKVIKETNFTFEGHPGKLLYLETKNNRFLRVKYLLIKTRLYTLLVSSGKTEPNVMGSENDYEKIAMTFLDSFQLIP